MNLIGKNLIKDAYKLPLIADGGTSQNVCFTDAGDWGEYMINLAKNASYQMIFRVASLIPGKFDISINGVIIKTDETFDATGVYKSIQTKLSIE
ncbi:carbohydrate-binding protein [Flavobacterium sp. 5]|uniref:carbohydrate-binding protein n=1 Tax=Flavobacterium sp. 5 TaxID=2035199 RepID=UPI0012FD948D|nr:carbohydrate-binding protein [Flavobacterium sp. 5]